MRARVLAISIAIASSSCGGGGDDGSGALRVGMNGADVCFARNAYTGQITQIAEYTDSSFVTAFAYAGFDPNSGQPFTVYGARYFQLSQVAQRFTRYHECAHVAVPTNDEIIANCAALRDLRFRGLSIQAESEIAAWHLSLGSVGVQYGGTGLAFWQATLTCAGPR